MCIYVLDYVWYMKHMCIIYMCSFCEKLSKMHVNTIFEDYRMKFDENEIVILTASILIMQ